ncbi:hypothetical protein GJAV_G00206060 [Gymnothorax javanicus]|nr:hypothetical protein GJAV_G00206060 [Gymnothorax javanicus]
MTSVVLPLLLLLCLHAVAEDFGEKNCTVTARVKRNSVHRTHIAESLRIRCPVVHCGKKPNVTWCKILNGNDCKPVTETGHIRSGVENGEHENGQKTYFLEFVKIAMNDTGLYRCEASGELKFISHSINVTVIAADDSRNSQSNETQTTTPSNYAEEDRSTSLHWLVYIYIAAGILVLVIIVTVTVYILRSKKLPTAAKRTQDPAQRNLQSSAPLIKEDPPLPSVPASQIPSLSDRSRSIRSPHRQRPPSVRSSDVSAPGPAPNHRSSRIQRPPATEAPPPRRSGTATLVATDGAGIYDNERDEAETPIVYAALNHQVAHKGQRRAHTYIPMDDLTEYAAIRVS